MDPDNLSPCHAGELIAEHLRLDSTAWSIGMLGAIAEFFRGKNEAFATDGVTRVVTGRGALRVVANGATRVVPYDTGGERRAIALCLPETACMMHRRRLITEAGPDVEALRKPDRTAVLFDLGLGSPFFDFYIRTADPDAIRRLREGAGLPLFDPRHGLLPDIAAMHPHRVFVSKLGRIEVFQRIASPGDTTPEGPHTHLLPALLKSGRVFDAETPIPSGWIPCATLYCGGAYEFPAAGATDPHH
jgi:hypothetical protein